MKDETKKWLVFAEENFQSAKILLKSHLYNPSLQNTQQAIEKYIKAYLIEYGIKLQKTHSILSLNEKPKKENVLLTITEDEIDLIDTIYLSSKYPFGSVLPDFEPNEKITLQCIQIAQQVQVDIKKYLS
ncbi:HEPN domain-containing protein [Sulfurimonas sp. NWX367]|uniref:HEPN domain-containing protein n=1 Tax=unclassified Sulfurimonas TaxID=2623549 RepID=UPI003204E7A4